MIPEAGHRDVAREALGSVFSAAGAQAPDLLERMTDGFIALDRDWRVVYMNRAARHSGEPPGDDVIGKSHWDQWPNTVGTEVERQYRFAMSTQQPVHFEHCYSIPGREFWHRIDAYPDANGLSIFFRDITEEKRSGDLARALAAASTRLVSTLELRAMMNEVASFPIPLLGQWTCVYLVDPTFRVTDVSSAAVDDRLKSILRYVVKQLPQHAIDPRLPWNRAMHTGEPVLLMAVDETFYEALGTPELRDFVNALAPQSLLCVPLIARGRTIGGITFGTTPGKRRHDQRDLLTVREVALPAGLALDTARLYEEQRRARYEAEDARRRAEEANVSKVDFLRAMSHEMRTPLNAIGGYVQLLRLGARGVLSPEVQRDLERMERNQQHITRLINDVVHFAKLEAGRIEFAPQRLELSRLMGGLGDFFDPQDAAGHRLTIEPCAPDVIAWADPDKVTQILVNLIGNAFKHTPEGTSIDVFSNPPGMNTHVTISVCDNGPGIPPDKHSAIFEPFVQVGRSLDHPVEGLGLGLAIARDLARRMGGELSVSSEPGKGTSFVLTLPSG